MGIIDRLKEHILVDGFHVVVDTEKSHESWIVDAETGKEYLDCYSQFASQALGWNHPYLKEREDYLRSVAIHKLANSDMYSVPYVDFVDKFAEATPDFKHYFFVDGGALGIENALKAAFDWRFNRLPLIANPNEMNVIHFKEAFHGRTGYTMSLTNNGTATFQDSSNPKTHGFPKFEWPRITNPKIHFPIDENAVEAEEAKAVQEMTWALKKRNTAAIIIEPIQGEGGDNHFRKEFFVKLRELADQHETLLIFDEVQTGVGLTGKMWCYEHFGVVPDMMCFGKKTQVCGFCATEKLSQDGNSVFQTSNRINSTWGGNIVDMVRSRIIIQAIKDLHLVERTAQTGCYFLEQLQQLGCEEVTNVRGRGLMLAFDLPNTERRDEIIHKLSDSMLVLKSGSRSIRFRPALTFSQHDVDLAIGFIKKSLS